MVRGALTHHGHEGNDAGAAAYEEHGPAGIRIPDEVTADGTAQLEPVSRVRIPGQIRRNLAVVDPLDGQLDARAAVRRRDRVAPLRLISVVRGQTNVDMLARSMPGPAFDVEREGLHPIGLGPHVRNLGDVPVQSPQYRCSFQGSP